MSPGAGRVAKWIALILVALAPRMHAQQRPHFIIGRVTTDSGAAIPTADVIVTIAPSAETIATKSDSTGNYRIVIANPTGEYLLYIGALGHKPVRQRVTITAPESTAVVNVKLAASVTTVATVRIEARRPRPTRTLGGNDAIGTDGNSKVVDGVANALPPELQGNFDAMASLIPGLAVTAAGVSAFGLGPDANMTTLNGMTFTGGAVPRDLATTTNFFQSSWDPTRGGFSGTLASGVIARGGNVTRHLARVTVNDPALQADDPIAARFGGKFTNAQVGDTRSGAFSLDKYFYNYGIQASRTTANVASLLSLDADALAHAGISADSAARLTELLAAAHIPLTVGGIPSQRTTTSALFVGRFDRAVPNPAGDKAPAPIYSLIINGSYQEMGAASLAPTVLPATTGSSTLANGSAQAQYSTYFGAFGDYANELAANVTFTDSRGSPYLSLPSGSVLIASSLAGVDSGTAPTIGQLSFGGNSALASDLRKWSFEVNNQTDFLVNHHPSFPAKLYLQSRYEHFDQTISANRLGVFSFASLNDLANDTPSTFARTLDVPERSGGEWTGAGALGGSWSIPKLILAGGARVDANVFTGLPTLNPQVASTFGIANDRGPNSVAISPRIGFNWYPNAVRGISSYGSNHSTTYRGAYQIRGGIGEFRSFLPSTSLADAIGTTGLAGSTQRLICVGPATPPPDWTGFASSSSNVPSSCLNGASTFADTLPNVALVSRAFAPSAAWRSTLGWTNTLRGNYIAVDGTYSLNVNQPSTVDLNFAGTPQFSLASEGGRPVFVPASSIVPSTGSASAVDSRISNTFGRVDERVSDLRGDTRQLTVYAIPNLPFSVGVVTLGYAYIDARSQARGFDQSTATDPRAVEWATSAFAPRHQFTFQAAHAFFGDKFAITISGRAMSGLRYTPTVAGDVNGDGYFNDRAFIFDPAKADTSVAHGLRELIASGSSGARNCLSAQLNTLAGRNSCVGPWTATMNANIIIPRLPRFHRVQTSINISNPLGGIDQLLHGSGDLHGWGSSPSIDGTLYQVRGFDPTSRAFIYQVNPRFGVTSPSASTFRTPFRLTLDVGIDYGPSVEAQNLQLALRIKPPLAGTRASADTIKGRYMNVNGTNGFSDIYGIILRYADSLALTRAQTESIQREQRVLRGKADSIYSILAAYLVALPANYDESEPLRRISDASDEMWTIVYAETPFLKALLTPGQIRLLPSSIRAMVTIPNYHGKFFYQF